jgi:hypothetical protein
VPAALLWVAALTFLAVSLKKPVYTIEQIGDGYYVYRGRKLPWRKGKRVGGPMTFENAHTLWVGLRALT